MIVGPSYICSSNSAKEKMSDSFQEAIKNYRFNVSYKFTSKIFDRGCIARITGDVKWLAKNFKDDWFIGGDGIWLRSEIDLALLILQYGIPESSFDFG